MSDFQPGFASRHDSAGEALSRAFGPVDGFAPADIAEFLRLRSPTGKPARPASEAAEPRHFSPASRDTSPTEGWDPFDPKAPQGDGGGFHDPLADARQLGFEEGRAAAIAEAEEAFERNRQMLADLTDALAKNDLFDRNHMAMVLRQTVLRLTERIVGDIGVSAELLTKRVDAASELLADNAESAMLRLNPEDVALLDGKLPKNIFPVGDNNVARGSFVLESASTIVEDGPGLWLEQLSEAIDRVAVPPKC